MQRLPLKAWPPHRAAIARNRLARERALRLRTRRADSGGYEKPPLVGADLTALLVKDRASNAELVVKLGMKKEGAK